MIGKVLSVLAGVILAALFLFFLIRPRRKWGVLGGLLERGLLTPVILILIAGVLVGVLR